jgi:predicted MFS family arabinose efflux permease
MGPTAAAHQLLVPHVTYMAPKAVRGQAVGKVVSGVMIGILLARPVSRFVADFRSRMAITIAGQFLVHFGAGETIHTENSYTHLPEVFENIALEAVWRLEERWLATDPAFRILLLRAAP